MQRRWIIAPIILIGLIVYSAVLAEGGARLFLPAVLDTRPTATPTPSPTPYPGEIPLDSVSGFISEVDASLWMSHGKYSYTDYTMQYESLRILTRWFNGDELLHEQGADAYLITPKCFGASYPVSVIPSGYNRYEILVVGATVDDERAVGLERVAGTLSGTELGQRATVQVRNWYDFPVNRVTTHGYIENRNRDILECGANDNQPNLAPSQTAFTVTEWFHYPNDEEAYAIHYEPVGYTTENPP